VSHAWDDEERFRSPPLDALGKSVGSDTLLGQFERHSLVLWLNKDLSAALDSRAGTLPSFSVEPPDSTAMRAFSAHLHETIHYWQVIGTTCGFLYALGDATSIYATMDDLIAGRHCRKPILRTLPENVDDNDPARLACIRWSHIEHGCAMLDDPAGTLARLQENRGGFVSPGQSLISLCANTAATLADVFDRSFAGLVNPDPWVEAYRKFVADRHSGFETDGVLQIRLGLRDLVEGQARISEIQHRDLTQRAVSWQEVKANRWLKRTYGHAFERYLQLTGLAEPETPRDDSVNLFLLLCDIAMNPAAGYADTIDPTRKFVHDFHPGVRFERLCRAVFGQQGVLHAAFPSLAAYEAVSAKLCGELGWKKPTEVGRLVLERWDKCGLGDELATQRETRDYGSVDVHRRFLIGGHRNFLDTRVQIPHFFCWPAWSVLMFDEDEEYAANINQVLSGYRCPFTAEEERGVTTVEIPGMAPDQQSQFVSDYFATLSLYDLTRQWISRPRQFVWDRFRWKRPLTTRDIERLKERFETTFRLPLDSIEPS
jgi:hypothetical protein